MAITTARYCDGGGIEVQYLDDSIVNERNGLPIVQPVAADDSVIIDTTYLNPEGVVKKIKTYLE